MFKKLRNIYHSASERSHHHTIIVGLGLFLFSFMAMWQMVPQGETSANFVPDRCMNNSNGGLSQTECDGLVQFYIDTNGGNWNSNTGRFEEPQICGNWYGIGCSGSEVTEISLWSNNLVGTADLEPLSGLTFINLGNNSISSINLQGLSSLQHIYLENNQLTDIDVSSLPNLYNLNIANNNISVINVSTNTNLQNLNVCNNNISSINLGNNSNLQVLSICDNPLSSLDISNNTGLTNLGISNTNINGLDLSQHTQLQGLSATNTNLPIVDLSNSTGLVSITALNANIEELYLPTTDTVWALWIQQNNISNIDLSSLSGLRILYINDNSLTSFDPGINNVNSLEELDLSSNNISSLGPNFIWMGNLQAGQNDNLNGNQLCTLRNDDPSLAQAVDENFSDWEVNQNCVLSYSCSNANVPQSECQVLETFYNDLDGANWNNNENWMTSNNICSRYGVKCDKFKVVGIEMGNNNLNGSLPDLHGLAYLETIDIWGEPNLSVNFSTFENIDLGKLKISQASLVGSTSVFENMTNMQDLALGRWNTPCDSVVGNFDFLAHMPDLVNFALNCSSTAGLQGAIPSGITQAGGLKRFHLDGGVNPNISVDLSLFSGFPLLEDFSVTDVVPSGDINAFSGKALNNFRIVCRAKETDCSNVIGDIAAIADMPLENELALDSPNIYGNTPASLWTRDQIRRLTLISPVNHGAMPTLLGFNNLRRLDLDFSANNNNVTLPDERAQLPQIQQIRIVGRSIIGELPASRSGMTTLEQLNIEFTDISGSIPPSRGSMTSLEHIHLINNKIGGQLPIGRGNISELSDIFIQGNYIYGPIPEGWKNISNPNRVVLQGNCLDTDISDPDLFDWLENHAGLRKGQANCLYNLQVSTSSNQNIINPGDTFTYTIHYINHGPQKAPKIRLAETFDPQLIVVDDGGSIDGYVGREYFVEGDACYDDMLNNQGVYKELIDSFILGASSNQFDSVSAAAILPNFLPGVPPYDPVVHLSESYYSLVMFCQYGLPEPASDLIACMKNNGLGEIQNNFSCGVGGVLGNVREFDTIPAGSSGSIIVSLQAPDTLVTGVTAINTTSVEGAGQNNGNTTYQTQIVIGQDMTQTPEDPEPDTPPSQPSPGPSGPGGTPTLLTDQQAGICGVRDCSDSYYDGECGVCDDDEEEEHESANEDEIFDLEKVIPSTSEIIEEMKNLSPNTIASTEEVKAYMFAKYVGITTKDTFEQADPQGVILRGDFAKMIVTFAENILGLQANESRRAMCSEYADNELVAGTDLEEFITRVCMHRIMGLDTDAFTPMESFNPFEVMNRAMIVTTLSRMIDQGKTAELYEPQVNYRTAHMESLLQKGIITVADPTLIDKRINAFIMLMRQVERQ